jgi:hypothetical protein
VREIPFPENPGEKNPENSLEEIDQKYGAGSRCGPRHLIAVERADIPASGVPDVEFGFPTNDDICGGDGPQDVAQGHRKGEREHSKTGVLNKVWRIPLKLRKYGRRVKTTNP